MRALVIGGTGPTGHYIVNGLLQRGYQVAILHTGNHEVDEIPPQVEHIHTNPYDEGALTAALAGREFELCVATYGRLRVTAKLMQGRCERFVSVGGQPCYRGYMNPYAVTPHGLPVPTGEGSELVSDPALDEKGYRIVLTEQQLFELQPQATHFRYPIVYGRYQAVPRDWCIVKRILDKRPHIIIPDGGLTLMSFGYAQNMAEAILLAVDKPDQACGEIFNCADTQTLTLRQIVEIIAEALDHDWRLVSMPWELATPAHPLIMQPLTTHRVIDTAKLQQRLGYTDVVSPREAFALTAHELAANPIAPDDWRNKVLEDPFDYAAEDQLIASWDAAMQGMAAPDFREELPGYGMAYSGPGGRPRTNAEFS
jgi:nucleoside-diphosphate-sugar epimerase